MCISPSYSIIILDTVNHDINHLLMYVTSNRVTVYTGVFGIAITIVVTTFPGK